MPFATSIQHATLRQGMIVLHTFLLLALPQELLCLARELANKYELTNKHQRRM